MTKLRLNPDLDIPALAHAYRTERRVRVEGLLDPAGAETLRNYLARHDQWWHLINTPDGIIELSQAKRGRMSAKRRAEIDAIAHNGARRGFQYRYEGLRVPDDPAAYARARDPLTAFARLMSSEPMLAMLRAVTGHDEMTFTDGHATAYGPGDFLTRHDDNVAGKNRLAAYVFGLTPEWRAEWGGLLLFHGDRDDMVTGHVPRFNTLDLFAVPQMHSVSVVTPAAPCRRFAVTGWLRAA